jgi:hypothetical protein
VVRCQRCPNLLCEILTVQSTLVVIVDAFHGFVLLPCYLSGFQLPVVVGGALMHQKTRHAVPFNSVFREMGVVTHD